MTDKDFEKAKKLKKEIGNLEEYIEIIEHNRMIVLFDKILPRITYKDISSAVCLENDLYHHYEIKGEQLAKIIVVLKDELARMKKEFADM